jgi:hypothetical protein
MNQQPWRDTGVAAADGWALHHLRLEYHELRPHSNAAPLYLARNPAIAARRPARGACVEHPVGSDARAGAHDSARLIAASASASLHRAADALPFCAASRYAVANEERTSRRQHRFSPDFLGKPAGIWSWPSGKNGMLLKTPTIHMRMHARASILFPLLSQWQNLNHPPSLQWWLPPRRARSSSRLLSRPKQRRCRSWCHLFFRRHRDTSTCFRRLQRRSRSRPTRATRRTARMRCQ